MKNHLKIRKVTSKISYVVIGLIVINYLIHTSYMIRFRVNGEYSK
jgi:hypothetical protein